SRFIQPTDSTKKSWTTAAGNSTGWMPTRGRSSCFSPNSRREKSRSTSSFAPATPKSTLLESSNHDNKPPLSMEIKLNEEQRLYVIPCGKGYTCLGFDNCFDETSQLAQLLNAAPPNPAQIGTQGQYDYYQNLIAQFCRRPDLNQETWFDPGTLEPVKERLEHARLHDQKLRLFFGNRETGQCWLEENDVLG